jgi:Fe-S-cluster containining protein
MSSKTPDFKYPKKIRFECMRCALCCGDTQTKTRHIIMTESEARRISEQTRHSSADFAYRIEGHAPYAYEMRKKREGTCVFLDEAFCTVYPFRPLVCRFYPFELKPEERGGFVFSYTDECPGIGRGKRLTRKEFQESLNEAKDRLC